MSKETKEAVFEFNLYGTNVEDISSLQEYINIVNLNIYSNKITALTPACSNMQNLSRIDARDNKLGINETSEKNESTDALSALYNKLKLSYVDIRNNSNLIWVGYLKNNNAINNLQMSGCNNINGTELASLRQILKQCGLNYSIPKEYSLAMLDEDTTVLDLSNQNLTRENFESLSGYTNISQLNLTNLNLSESDGTSLSAEEANEVINKVLNTLTGMKYLQLWANNSNTSIAKSSSIDFVKNDNPNTGMPELIELDIRGTNVTTENAETGLQLLNLYCPNMGTLGINNSNIDLTKIQETISRLEASPKLIGSAIRGLYLEDNATLLKQLENCREITKLVIWRENALEHTGIDKLDLSACSNLTQVKFCKLTYKDVILPSSVKYVYAYKSGFVDCSNITSLDYYYFGQYDVAMNHEFYNRLISSLKNCESINEMNIFLMDNDELGDLSFFSSLENCNINELNIGGRGYSKIYLTGISGIQYLHSLKKLSITYSNLSDLYDLKNNTELEELDLKYNAICNLKGIENLKKLVTLNLENNIIYDDGVFENERYKNLEIIKLLHPNNGGALKSIYLANNENILDYSIISSLSWDNRSGF